MSLPAERLYLCWDECVPTQDCQLIIQRFAEDNFTNIVDSKIWRQDYDGSILTNVEFDFNPMLYKINCEALAYNGSVYSIMPMNMKKLSLHTQKYLGRLLEYTKFPVKTKCLSVFNDLSPYYDISKLIVEFDEHALFWFVDSEHTFDNTPSGSTVFDCWKLYNDPSDLDNEMPGSYVLVIKNEVTTELYHHLERIVKEGSDILVVTRWTPCLPVSINDRTWCFANVTQDRSCEHFIPKRVSRAKSARK